MPKRFSASSAAMLMSCHASGNLELAIPNWQPPVRNEDHGMKATGRSYHAIVDELMSMTTVTPKKVRKSNAKDLAKFAELLLYVSSVWSRRRFTTRLNEHKMTATWLASQPTTTADIIFATSDELHILDPKMGTIPVHAVDNDQLLFYAACAVAEGLAPKATEVHLHIVQPWADNYDEWVVSAQELKDWMDRAIATDAAIAAGSTTFGVSDHCTFCPANPHSRGDKAGPFCPEMLQLLYPSQSIDEDAILALGEED